MGTAPEVGLELVNPVAGTCTRFVATAASTDGAYVEIEVTYPPNSSRPPVHLHPTQDEHFSVLSGRVTVIRGDEQLAVGAGETFDVPRGVRHQMWAEDEGAVMLWRTSPAQRTGEMFCELWEVARDKEWAPAPLDLFAVLAEHEAEFRLA